MTQKPFDLFISELKKWNKSINLVQENTINELETRHILDSLELKPHIDFLTDTILDIGSGAGFPGLILAIEGAKNSHLVEPNGKKVVFLNHIKQLYNLPIVVHHCRWQQLTGVSPTVVTSRAFAPLSELLEIINFVSRETNATRGVFLKGKKIQEEVLEAQKKWNFKIEIFKNSTSEDGCIVKIWGVHKK
ncbi:MAG: 16S rRNA (guanine(527)-N(7))-methyltransferase RsmG [Proteobacteria bacterium]|nr:16S rRNA (guanine(527)-N(7))-methyltransferase RsmG [Pseudomonadota bacterium]